MQQVIEMPILELLAMGEKGQQLVQKKIFCTYGSKADAATV